MKHTTSTSLALAAALISIAALSGCQQYLERRDLVSPYAGDAVARNASNQTIDPWPRYVYDTDIRTSSERQAGALKRYHTANDAAPAASPGVIQLQAAPSPTPTQ